MLKINKGPLLLPGLGLRTAHALIIALPLGALFAVGVSGAQAPSAATDPRTFLDKYCVTCHNQKLHTAGLALDSLDVSKPGADAKVCERVIAKLRAGSMPPPGMTRPDAATSRSVAASLENDIDRAWAAKPNPGRISAAHRLN